MEPILLYLKPWGDERYFTSVSIDPTTIWGQKDIFGQTLFFPCRIDEKVPDRSVRFHLLSLEGWIGWGNTVSFSGTLRIPLQTMWDDPNQRGFRVPITDVQIEAIEEARKGSNVIFSISLGGQALIKASSTSPDLTPTPYADRVGNQISLQNVSPVTIVLERERWLTTLQQLGAGTRRLVELPEPRLPQGEQEWRECLRLLDEATRFYRSGEYEQALKNCRSIVEGIPHVLCQVWGLRKPQKNKPSFEGWLKEIDNRLTLAWEDDLTPGMLRTMLTGAWQWLAPAPHYGTGIPLREDVSFALGLCTDLLSFAGNVLQAHPYPIAIVSTDAP